MYELYEPIPRAKLRALLREGIQEEISGDRYDLYLPYFSEGEPLRLTWTRNGSCYTISDNGRAMAELEKKVGSPAPRMDDIHAVLRKCGSTKLVGGRTIQCTYHAMEAFYHTDALDYILSAISIVSNLDILQICREGCRDEI